MFYAQDAGLRRHAGNTGYFLQSLLELAPRAGMEDENEVVPGGSAFINMAGGGRGGERGGIFFLFFFWSGRGGGNADAEGGQNAGYFRNDARLVHHLEADVIRSDRIINVHDPAGLGIGIEARMVFRIAAFPHGGDDVADNGGGCGVLARSAFPPQYPR